jgi:glycosyltransferase involved in cell wall biosynthesis
MNLKIAYIVSDIDKSLAFEWTSLELSKHYSFIFILIGKENSSLSVFCEKNKIKHYNITNGLSKPGKWLRIFNILFKEKPDVIHTHLWQANILGLSAGWILRIKKRIFTRHHALVHYDEFPGGRKWDLLCNYLATDIIAISENIKSILITRDKASAGKIVLIHHGFNLAYFSSKNNADIYFLHDKYSIPKNGYPIIGVIARHLAWKGIDYVITAFKKLLQDYPDAYLILANAQGPYKSIIEEKLSLISTKNYKQIAFEENLVALYKLFDVYIHTPINEQVEAFGQTYVEALASQTPSIFTLSGVAKEFISDKQNAMVVPFKNSDEIYLAINSILNNKDLKEKLIKNGLESVQPFEFNVMLRKLISLYEK